jgi:hypothetical protein
LALSPEASIWIEARRAGTTSAGVEGPGSNAPQTARGPEGRYNLNLVANQNLATLGCVSPSGLAIHRGLQPVVTTTGKGYASPPGLMKVQRLPFGFRPEDFILALSPKASIWLEARRAGISSAGVEGPGSKALQTARRPGGPIQPGFSWPIKI